MSHREHKDRQVCRQVFEALALAWCDLGDPIADLALVSVDPAPDAKRVMVTLVPTRPDVDLDAATRALDDALPTLRAEVATEIHRKRVPEIAFRITLQP